MLSYQQQHKPLCFSFLSLERRAGEGKGGGGGEEHSPPAKKKSLNYYLRGKFVINLDSPTHKRAVKAAEARPDLGGHMRENAPPPSAPQGSATVRVTADTPLKSQETILISAPFSRSRGAHRGGGGGGEAGMRAVTQSAEQQVLIFPH